MNQNNGEPKKTPRERGFLPIDTNLFDRYFISVVILIAIHLLWLRFLESFLSIYFATLLSLVVGYFIVRRG